MNGSFDPTALLVLVPILVVLGSLLRRTLRSRGDARVKRQILFTLIALLTGWVLWNLYLFLALRLEAPPLQ